MNKKGKNVLIAGFIIIFIMIISYISIGNPFEFNKQIRDVFALRIVMPLFLHKDSMHLGNNIILLLLLSYMLKEKLTASSFVIVFVLSGIMGNVLTVLLMPEINAIGASGGIMGLSGVAFVIYGYEAIQNKEMNWQILFLTLFLVNDSFELLANKSINNISHISGLLIGVFIGIITNKIVN